MAVERRFGEREEEIVLGTIALDEVNDIPEYLSVCCVHENAIHLC